MLDKVRSELAEAVELVNHYLGTEAVATLQLSILLLIYNEFRKLNDTLYDYFHDK